MFDLSNLEDKLQNPISKFFDNISDEVANIGYWCSIEIVGYAALETLYRIYATLTLRFRKQVPLGEAISLAFFLENRMQNTLANYEESRREVYDEVTHRVTAAREDLTRRNVMRERGSSLGYGEGCVSRRRMHTHCDYAITIHGSKDQPAQHSNQHSHSAL